MFLYITWISPKMSPETHLKHTWIYVTFRWDFLFLSGWSGCPDDCHTAIKVHICPTPLHSLTWQATQSHIAASSDDWQVHGHGQVSGQATQSHWPVTASDARAVSQPPQLLSELLGCLADNKAREMVKIHMQKCLYNCKLSLAMITDICEHYMRWLWLINALL